MLKHTMLSLHTAMHKNTPDIHETLLMLYWYTVLNNNNTAVTEYSQNGHHLMSSVQCISMQLGVNLFKIMSKIVCLVTAKGTVHGSPMLQIGLSWCDNNASQLLCGMTCQSLQQELCC